MTLTRRSSPPAPRGATSSTRLRRAAQHSDRDNFTTRTRSHPAPRTCGDIPLECRRQRQGLRGIGTGHPTALAVIDFSDLPRKEARGDGDYSASWRDEQICGGCGARPALRMLRCVMTFQETSPQHHYLISRAVWRNFQIGYRSSV